MHATLCSNLFQAYYKPCGFLKNIFYLSCGRGVTGARRELCIHDITARFWAIQAGLLTPLTSAWHCLSPLVAYTSGAYFLHNGRQ